MLYNVVLVSAIQQPKSVSSNIYIYRLPWWLSSKEYTCNTGDAGDVASVPELGRSPGGGIGILLQFSCLENLTGNEPWGRKESDTTEVTECP